MIRIFTKTLTFKDIMEYKEDENFHYLVIESCLGEYYGFNINIKKERSYATKIVSPDERDDFMVVGWKVAKKRPKWICNADSWIDFISRKDNIKNKPRVDNEDGEEEDEAVDHKEHFINNKEVEECWGLYNCLDRYRTYVRTYVRTFEYARKIAPSCRDLDQFEP